MSFDSAEYAWNSVDVRGDDGLLHNGRVIDAVDGHLVVHFGGTEDSGSRLVRFGDVYFRHYSIYLGHVRTCIEEGQEPVNQERPVEGLLRVKPEDPWKWYPGMLLDGFGLVSVTLPERDLKGLVVEQRVRKRSTDGDLAAWRVVEGQFSKKMVIVPSEFSAAPDDQLIAAFNAHSYPRLYWMMATEVRRDPHRGSGKLVILALNDDDINTCWSQFVSDFLKRDQRQPPLDAMLLYVLKDGADTLHSVRMRLPSTDMLRSDGDIHSLYRDPTIFPLIFECLTTIQQTKLRAVCKIWDALLLSPRIRSVLALSSARLGPNCTNEQYCFASCLYNCRTQQTKTVTISSGEYDHEYLHLESIAHLLLCTMADKGLSAGGTLLLTGWWRFLGRTSNWVNALCETFMSLMGACQQVVFKKFGIYLDLTESTRYRDEDVSLGFSNLRLTRQLTVNSFWAILNDGLPDLDPEIVQRLGEWIRGNAAFPRTTSCKRIAEMLNLTQTLDTRVGVRYRGMYFAPFGDAGLKGVDVRFLTKLTLHALHQLLQNRGHCP